MEWGSGDQLESVQSGKAPEIRGSNKTEQTRRNGVEWIFMSLCVVQLLLTPSGHI
jgi:hypothetical protein